MENYRIITGDISTIILTKNIAKSHIHNLRLIARINKADSPEIFKGELQSRQLSTIKKLKEQCEQYVNRVEHALDSLSSIHREIIVEEFFQNRRSHFYHHYSKSSYYRYRKAACDLFVEAFNKRYELRT